MKYAKLIDNELFFAPNPIIIADRQIGNPPGSVYEAEGYKPIRYTDPPQTDPGYIAVSGWEETLTEIVQVWTVKLAPVSEDEAILRYANELTEAEDETLEEAAETLIKKVMEVN